MWVLAVERRWRAAREAGMATVPAVVRQADDRDSLLLALVENVAREQLSPVEEARAYAALVDEFSLSLGDVAERVGRSKPPKDYGPYSRPPRRRAAISVQRIRLGECRRGQCLCVPGAMCRLVALPFHAGRGSVKCHHRLHKSLKRDGYHCRG